LPEGKRAHPLVLARRKKRTRGKELRRKPSAFTTSPDRRKGKKRLFHRRYAEKGKRGYGMGGRNRKKDLQVALRRSGGVYEKYAPLTKNAIHRG